VYYPHVPSIVGRRRGKQTYYYLVESARVDGQPRIVSQQYLGTAEEVMARLSGAAVGAPVRTEHKRFGDLAAVWSVLERLEVAEAVDAVVPRRAHAGASVGTYIALATANRVMAPCSKLGFADWRASGDELTAADLLGRARALHRAFEGVRMDVVDRVETPDRVVVSFRLRGRHAGPLAIPLGTVAASGREVDVRTIDILSVQDGRITGIFVVADELGMRTQLGAAALAP
jgi:ketosteroid isomerase-like protein